MTKIDGGPVFPQPAAHVQNPNSHTPVFYPSSPGMSLRDWFAGHALTGMLAHSRNNHGYRPRDPNQPWHEAISQEAYQIADAMIKARERLS